MKVDVLLVDWDGWGAGHMLAMTSLMCISMLVRELHCKVIAV